MIEGRHLPGCKVPLQAAQEWAPKYGKSSSLPEREGDHHCLLSAGNDYIAGWNYLSDEKQVREGLM
jgi:hypothetical protein